MPLWKLEKKERSFIKSLEVLVQRFEILFRVILGDEVAANVDFLLDRLAVSRHAERLHTLVADVIRILRNRSRHCAIDNGLHTRAADRHR